MPSALGYFAPVYRGMPSAWLPCVSCFHADFSLSTVPAFIRWLRKSLGQRPGPNQTVR